jgi:shikimate 5-dehydrogenase
MLIAAALPGLPFPCEAWLIGIGVTVAALAAPFYGAGGQADAAAWASRTANRVDVFLRRRRS